jgi:hypothetical protein
MQMKRPFHTDELYGFGCEAKTGYFGLPDYQISHEKNPRLARVFIKKRTSRLNPKSSSKMMEDLDLYIDSVISLLRANISKTRLKRRAEEEL